MSKSGSKYCTVENRLNYPNSFKIFHFFCNFFSAPPLGNSKLNQISDKMKYYLNSGLEKLSDTLSIPAMDRFQNDIDVDRSKIVFILPLAGRYETLLRFLNNYEDVSIFF
jgi:hypothetical protein